MSTTGPGRPPPTKTPALPACLPTLRAGLTRPIFDSHTITPHPNTNTTTQLTKPGEREFMQLFVKLVGKEADVTLYSSDANTFPRQPLPASMQYQLKAAFIGMNVLKLLRSGLGLDVGPSFLDHMTFPIWRPPIW